MLLCAGRLEGKYRHKFNFKINLLHRKNGRNKLSHFPHVISNNKRVMLKL